MDQYDQTDFGFPQFYRLEQEELDKRVKTKTGLKTYAVECESKGFGVYEIARVDGATGPVCAIKWAAAALRDEMTHGDLEVTFRARIYKGAPIPFRSRTEEGVLRTRDESAARVIYESPPPTLTVRRESE